VVATLLLGRFHHARRALIRVAQHPRIRYNFAGSVVTESDPKISHGRKRWELDREGWETLLSALAPDRDLAGQKYEELRRRLTDLFAWERCGLPDQLADEALNRLARKLTEGVAIPHLDRYAFGIARFLIQEDLRARRNRDAALREFPMSTPEGRSENMVSALEECLGGLPDGNRRLIERYYAEDRAALAGEFGISVNALRNRAMRIREELFQCVSRKCDDA
jgi:DNA-directed RNA polymerase specialized sigma24 family protein